MTSNVGNHGRVGTEVTPSDSSRGVASDSPRAPSQTSTQDPQAPAASSFREHSSAAVQPEPRRMDNALRDATNGAEIAALAAAYPVRDFGEAQAMFGLAKNRASAISDKPLADVLECFELLAMKGCGLSASSRRNQFDIGFTLDSLVGAIQAIPQQELKAGLIETALTLCGRLASELAEWECRKCLEVFTRLAGSEADGLNRPGRVAALAQDLIRQNLGGTPMAVSTLAWAVRHCPPDAATASTIVGHLARGLGRVQSCGWDREFAFPLMFEVAQKIDDATARERMIATACETAARLIATSTERREVLNFAELLARNDVDGKLTQRALARLLYQWPARPFSQVDAMRIGVISFLADPTGTAFVPSPGKGGEYLDPHEKGQQKFEYPKWLQELRKPLQRLWPQAVRGRVADESVSALAWKLNVDIPAGIAEIFGEYAGVVAGSDWNVLMALLDDSQRVPTWPSALSFEFLEHGVRQDVDGQFTKLALLAILKDERKPTLAEDQYRAAVISFIADPAGGIVALDTPYRRGEYVQGKRVLYPTWLAELREQLQRSWPRESANRVGAEIDTMHAIRPAEASIAAGYAGPVLPSDYDALMELLRAKPAALKQA